MFPFCNFPLKGDTASECKTGTNPDYESLCSVDEDYFKHADAHTYFNNESPVVTQWLESGKQIETADVTLTYKKLKQ